MTTETTRFGTTTTTTTAADARPTARGLRNLVQREASAFWRTRAWWVQAVSYLLLANGLAGAATLGVARSGALARGDLASDEVGQLFFVFHFIFVAAGTIVTAQGSILGEKQRGTAAWILSKPVSRGTFVLAKGLALAAHAIAVGVLIPVAVMIPIWRWTGFTPSLPSLVLIVTGLALLVAFFSSLTLMLGTLFDSRAAIAGTALVTLFAMIQLGQVFPDVLPGGIPFALVPLLRNGPVSSATPFLVTLVATVAWFGVAVWRFRRTEF
jgi:ABC-2 type transport system permease protein